MSCGEADLRQASDGTPPAAGATLRVVLRVDWRGLMCVMERA
jgi:hypothetical protein